MKPARVGRTLGRICAAGALLLASGLAAPGRAADAPDLPEPPAGFDPTVLGRRTVRIVRGRVLATSPDAAGRACPTSLGGVSCDDGTTVRGVLALPWDADAPPWNGWTPRTDGAESPASEACCALDRKGRLVAALGGGARSDDVAFLAAGAVPSARFTDRELAWAWIAVRRGGARTRRVSDDPLPEDERWRRVELALRFEPNDVRDEADFGDATPVDLLRLAVPRTRACLELLRRGEPVDLARLRGIGAISVGLAAGDAATRAQVRDGLASPHMPPRLFQEIAGAGFRDDAEMRTWLAPHVRRGDRGACIAWLAVGGTYREMTTLVPEGAEFLRFGEPKDAPSPEWLAVAAAASTSPTPGGSRDRLAPLHRSAKIALAIRPEHRAAARAAWSARERIPDDPVAEAIRLGVLAHLGDAAALARLARTDWTTLAPVDERFARALLDLVGDVSGEDAVRTVVTLLARPPQLREPIDSTVPDTVTPKLAARPAAERAFGASVLDAISPRPLIGDDPDLVLRWVLGVPPTVAVLRAARYGQVRAVRCSFLPRGVWGPDADALRAELTRRDDWRSLLALDGTIPAEVADRAVACLDPAAKDAMFRQDAIEIVARTKPRDDEGLPGICDEMLRQIAAAPAGRFPASGVADGILTRLVLRRR